ncbi:MAG TPA: HNH endonuclease signature motif containing protein [Pseudobdellovibrionaceae bacterium]
MHKPQKNHSVRVELTFTQEEYEILQQTKSLLSHSCPQGSLSEVIVHLANKLVKTKLGKTSPNSTQCNTEAEEKAKTPQKVKCQKNSREFISVRVRRILLKKAHHCCEYVHPQTGVRCTSKYQLEIEHIKPVAFGGGNELENLMILCRTHNLQAAENLGLRSH